MRVFVAGALGNIGANVLRELDKLSYTVLAFDKKTKKTEKKYKELAKKISFKMIWGDLLQQEDYKSSLKDTDVIIHLAAVIPPDSERFSDFAREINVGGTKLLLEAVQRLEKKPKIVFASSFAVYGKRGYNNLNPININDPLIATDNYSTHKIEAEALIKENSLSWSIIRFGAVLSLEILNTVDPLMFNIPLNQRLEFIHPQDAGKALVTLIDSKFNNKIFLGGGGKSCQISYHELTEKILKASGIGMLPRNSFIEPKSRDDYHYFDFMDTEESQNALQFQNKSFNDYIRDYSKKIGFKKYFVTILRPLIRYMMLKKSPYYNINKNS